MVLSNGVVELTFESDLERTVMTTLRKVESGAVIAVKPEMVYYTGGRHPQKPPWVVRPSGQYIFHPAKPAEQVLLRSTASCHMSSCSRFLPKQTSTVLLAQDSEGVCELQLVERNATGAVVPMAVEGVVGPLVIEVRQRFDVHTELVTRCVSADLLEPFQLLTQPDGRLCLISPCGRGLMCHHELQAVQR